MKIIHVYNYIKIIIINVELESKKDEGEVKYSESPNLNATSSPGLLLAIFSILDER